jgi:hypothetical protein
VSIEVSGGGSIAVETEALLDARRRLERLAGDADGVHDELGAVVTKADASAAMAVWVLTIARNELALLTAAARVLAVELEVAAELYGAAERAADARSRLLAWLLGPGPVIARAAELFAVDSLRNGGIAFGDPAFVRSLSEVADAIDPAAVLAAVRALPGGALDETPVTATRVVGASVPIAAAPRGFGELARRIPPAKEGGPQVRVERYALPDGEVHWVVYVGGTIDWSLVAGTEPWDDTSNVVGVAGGSAGSTRATMLALEKAGWKPGEAILPVGHSQGGIVATAIATGGAAAVPMLVTFGSPTAGVAVPRGMVDVAVEHGDDPVPALGGSARPLIDPRLVVRENAPAAAEGAPGLPAHAMVGYEQTAVEMDTSSDQRLVDARATLERFTGGGQAEVSMWRGGRVPSLNAARGE